MGLTPRPDRYCPLAEGSDLPFDLIREIGFTASYQIAAQVRRCLCVSVASSNLTCSPSVCTVQLLAAYRRAQSAQVPMAAFTGAVKKIYRDYVKAVSFQPQRLDDEWDDFMNTLFDE